MPTDAEESVYPLSDPRGVPIPFDVGDPEGLWITPVAVAASALKTLPATWDVVVLYATTDCVIGFGAAVTLDLTQDVAKADHQFIPAYTPVSIKLPHISFKIMAVSSDIGILYIQKYRKWKAVSQSVLQGRM